MGYEVVYNPKNSTYAVWSTIIDDWIASGLKTPQEVADWIVKYSGGGEERKRYWIQEAEKARTTGKYEIKTIVFRLNGSELVFTGFRTHTPPGE